MTACPAILRVMCVLAFKRAVQYRAARFIEGAVSLFMVAVQLIPIFVLFGQRDVVADWSYMDRLFGETWRP